MKRLLFVFMFLLPLSLLAQTTYYVSNSGSDSNSGMSESSPWKSLTKVNSYFFMAGDKILFKRGDSWEGTITVRTSGTAGNPITYGAYGSGDKPKIYGSEVITGWTRYSGNIYKATFNKKINQLFLNGERMKAARYPNSGYFYVSSVSGQTTFTSNSLNSNINYAGAKWIGRTAPWVFQTKDVVRSSSSALTLSSSPSESLGVDEGFFLTNKLEFLDSEREWFYSTSTNTIYFFAIGSNSPSNYVVRGATIDYAFYVEKKSFIVIEDFCLLHFKNTGISITNSTNITVSGNEVLYPDSKGIELIGGNSSCSIIDNIVNGANHYGIKQHSTGSTVSGNQILNIAMFNELGVTGMGDDVLSGKGVDIEGDGNLVSYNRVINVAYTGISFVKRNVIEYNYISEACMVKADGGGIYTYSSSIESPSNSGSIVKNNIIDKVVGPREGSTLTFDQAVGIYTDNNSGGITIENNTIVDCSRGGIVLHKNKGINVKNNTVMDAHYLIYTSGDNGANSITNNIIYALELNKEGTGNQKLIIERFTNSSHYYNNNIYVNHYYNDNIFVKTNQWSDPAVDSYSFVEWRSVMRLDINSTCDVSKLSKGETEKLLYNDTKEVKIFNLGTSLYKDVEGNIFSVKLALEPFSSKILVGTDFDNIEIVEESKNDSTVTDIAGNEEVYDYTVSMSDRRAMPVILANGGKISSMSLYHNGGSGSMLLGVYSDDGGVPGSLMGVSDITPVNSSEGWQTVLLQDEVSVSAGEQVWLAWVSENPTEVRYGLGGPGRALSEGRWSGGMPSVFGSSVLADYRYSVYCTYTTVGSTVTDTAGNGEVYDYTVSMSDRRAMPVILANGGKISSMSLYHNGGSGSMLLGVYSDDGGVPGSLMGVSDITPVNSSEGWQTVLLQDEVSVSAGEQVWLAWVSENPTEVRYGLGGPGRALSEGRWSGGMPSVFGSSVLADYRYSVYCTYTTVGSTVTDTAGNEEVYDYTVSMSDRRAMPVILANGGKISSMSLYHNGGSGSMLLGVYSDDGGVPGSLMGVSDITPVNSSEGWQTVLLQDEVSVSAGEQVWLAWVSENPTEVRYGLGGPGRALSEGRWSGGMPSVFGSSVLADYRYSVYCTYTTVGSTVTDTAGNEEVYDYTVSMSDRRAMPVILANGGKISSMSLYHNGGSGSMLLGVYSDDGGVPGSLMGVSDITPVNSSEGWQTVLLQDEVSVSAGEQVWLAWVSENPTEVRYGLGGPGRALSEGRWSGGMPSVFGSSVLADYRYSVYCTYTTVGSTVTDTAGNGEVYDYTVSMSDRRAMPVILANGGKISSMSLYHNGGSGSMLLGVYSDDGGVPGSLMGVSDITPVNSSEGWQTVLLQDEVSVSAGEQVWLAWVSENPTEVRYGLGGPGRALSEGRWSGGMPSVFGSSVLADYRYSVYCTYSKSLSKSVSVFFEKMSTVSPSGGITQYSTEEVTINEGETYQSWKEPGTYQRALTASSGADSIVTTILYVVPAVFAADADNNREVITDLNNDGILSEQDLNIYPNPASTYVNIEYLLIPGFKTKMIMLDNSGKIVFNQFVDFMSIRVDVSGFPSGIYFVRMINEESAVTKKLIISR